MLLELYQFDYQLKEYENRVDAILLERALHKAQIGRPHMAIQQIGRCVRLVARLAMVAWRWGQSTLHSARWTQHDRPQDGTT